EQPEQHPDQGGLARTIGTEQSHDLAGPDLQVNLVDRGERAEPPGYVRARSERVHVAPPDVDASAATVTASCRSGVITSAPAGPAASPPGSGSQTRHWPARRQDRAAASPSGLAGTARSDPGMAATIFSAVPEASTVPESRTRTDAHRSASSRYVVASTIAQPSAAARAISHHKPERLTGSTPVVGSSSTSRSG